MSNTEFDTESSKLMELKQDEGLLEKDLETYDYVDTRKISLAYTIDRLDHLDYLYSNTELFARSYAQYIATKTNSNEIFRQLASDEYYYLWESADFEPIAAAFDEILRSVALLRTE